MTMDAYSTYLDEQIFLGLHGAAHGVQVLGAVQLAMVLSRRTVFARALDHAPSKAAARVEHAVRMDGGLARTQSALHAP